MSQNESQNQQVVELIGRREFIKKSAVGAGVLAATMAMPGFMFSEADAAQLKTKFKDYNVVFVSFDALQAAHVGALGYKKGITPTIDAMAQKGYNFTNNISVAPWTVPASMTWFTGVYPSEHRLLNKFSVYNPPNNNVLSNLKKLSPELVTLAEVLKQNGYATGGFTGNAGVNGIFGYSQGFDEYYSEKGKFGSMGVSIPKGLDWLKKNKDKKFFMFLHGYDMHGQFVPEEGFDYRFVDKGYDKKYTGSAKEQEALREEGLANGTVKLRDEDVKFWRAIYDEKIQKTDAKFKEFLKEMEKMGLMDKTIFVLTSDHGTEFHEHKRFDHGFSLYDELIHVPLIIKLPKQKSGKVVKDQVSSVDIMPTVLDLLDVKMPSNAAKQLRGTSLVPALKGKPVAEDVFFETNYRQYTYKRGIRTKDGWKLVYTLEDKSRELYNLTNDPKETKNLVDREPRRAYELEQRIFAHFKSIGHDLNAQQWITGLNPVYDSQAKGAQNK
ncbi:MAG: sulfatase [Desulfuromonadaceae bacterium]|nr:sulfatase [Desulfuromonadaceae bacterium]MDD2854343.1 sulfatase [Desulfuromonadaceae bacterium]